MCTNTWGKKAKPAENSIDVKAGWVKGGRKSEKRDIAPKRQKKRKEKNFLQQRVF